MKEQNFTVNFNETIEKAFDILKHSPSSCLLAVNKKNELIGTVTNGDLRRFLINNPNIKSKIRYACNKKFFSLKKEKPNNEIKKILIKKKLPLIPLINKKKVIKCFFFKDLIKSNLQQENIYLKNFESVIMAGGLGQRLKPFSDVLPKPLIPFEEKTVLDFIVEKYLQLGIKKIFLTLNYKKNIIKSYIRDQYRNNKKFFFIDEKKRLGTASSLKLIKEKTKKNLIVSNCDTILKINFEDFIKFHIEEKNDFTLVAAMKKFSIPYGVCIATKKKKLKKINEKPSVKFLVNVGTYIVNNKLLTLIPKNKFFDMNEFIYVIKKKNFKVGLYPIDESDWIDTGVWEGINIK